MVATKTKAKQRKNSGKAKRHGLDNLKGNTFRDKPERINKKGRPLKIYSQFADQGYTRSQINDCISAMIGLPVAELKTIQKSTSPKYTALEKVVSSVLVKSFKDGAIRDVEVLLARVHGGPNTRVALDIGLNARTNKRIYIPDNGRDTKDIIQLNPEKLLNP